MSKRQPDSAKLRDADRTRGAILDAATEEFGSKGFGGARLEVVAQRAGVSKRMIFHYFTDKARLYATVLEAAYNDVRTAEEALSLTEFGAAEALVRLVEHTFSYNERHPAFVRLVMAANLEDPRDAAPSTQLQAVNVRALRLLEDLLARGRREGVFNDQANALDLHLLISATCFFRVSNARTFGAAFGVELADPELRSRHRQMATDVVLQRVTKPAR